jgi:hypothetical protein
MIVEGYRDFVIRLLIFFFLIEFEVNQPVFNIFCKNVPSPETKMNFLKMCE